MYAETFDQNRIFSYNQGMRRWNLTGGNSFNLTLTADVRAGGTDYSDDHIWELRFGGGEPPAIALGTTFGLRARGLRLFPRFVLGDQEACDPDEFARGPVVRNFYTNFVRLDFSPFPDIDVKAEYWVPQSHAILGRFWITNRSESDCDMRLEWAAVLAPNEGQRMAADQIEGSPVLCGETANLSPVVFMTHKPGDNPRAFFLAEVTEDDEQIVNEFEIDCLPLGAKRIKSKEFFDCVGDRIEDA